MYLAQGWCTANGCLSSNPTRGMSADKASPHEAVTAPASPTPTPATFEWLFLRVKIMTDELQRLTGENKSAARLAQAGGNVIDSVLDDNDLPSYEIDPLIELLSQINSVVGPASADLLGAAE